MEDISEFLIKSNSAILLTTSGYNNVGQESIVGESIRKIREMNPEIKLFITTNNVFQSKKLHKYNRTTFVSYYSPRLYFALFFTKLILIIGDEISSERLDIYYPNIKDFFQGKFRLFFSVLSLLCYKNLIFYSIGISSFQHKFPTNLLKICISKSKFFSVRDKYSKHFLEDLGGNREIKITEDIAYSQKYEKKRKQKNAVGISLMDPLNEKYEQKTIRLIKSIIKERKHRIYFFIFSNCKKPIQENDLIYTKKIIKKINTKFNYKIYNFLNPYKLKSEMSSMSCFLSMRLHGAIFAESLVLPFRVIPSKNKIRSFFNDNKKVILDFEELPKFRISSLY